MIGATEIRLSPDELPKVCRTLMAEGARLQMAYAWFPEPGTPEVIYLADKKRLEPFPLLRCRLLDGRREVPSLAAITPLLGWYEREIQDLCGIRFTGHPEPGQCAAHDAFVEMLEVGVLDVQSVGDVAAKIRETTGADVEMRSTSGDLVIDMGSGRKTGERELDARIGAGGAKVRLRSFSGDVTVGE